MIYNMLTLSIQLLLIGFFVGAAGILFFKKDRPSQTFPLELGLSVLGSFLGTLLEVILRSLFDFPMIVHQVNQFLVPFTTAILVLVLYRLSNNFRG